MIKLDHNLLAELGLGDLSQESKDSLLAHVYDKLEINVGMAIAAELSDEQLDEFEALIDGSKQDEARDWLQANYPDYKKVVQEELEKLKNELKNNAKTILENETT